MACEFRQKGRFDTRRLRVRAGYALVVWPIRRLARNRRAVAVFEYALIASMIAVAVAIVVTSVDINVDGIVASFGRMFSTTAEKL